MIRAPMPTIGRDARGAAIVEFAIVAPVMVLFLLGAFDTAHTLYMRGVLQGIVQKTARDSALETGTALAQQAALDNRVRDQVLEIANTAKGTTGNIVFTRRYYRTFSDAAAAKAEVWNDTNNNGKCDAGEPYIDANNNSVWDADGGDDGQGGAKDKTLYTVTVSYKRFFPLYRLISGSDQTVITAQTVLINQPYNDQGSYDAPTQRNCK